MYRRCLVCAVYLVLLSMFAFAEEMELSVIFIDVGHGDAAILQCEGEAMLIDAGPANAWTHIQAVLKDEQVGKLKYLVATHPHQDHIANIPQVLDAYSVGAVLLPPIEMATQVYDNMIEAIAESGAETIYPFVGDTFTLGGTLITVYAPHPVAYSNPNDWSIVMMVSYADRSILFCGDAEYESEMDVLAENAVYPLSADIIKIGHHGSDTSSNRTFIEAVSPRIAVISCGDNDEYPSTDVAMTLYDCGIEELLTTSMHGDILIRITIDKRISIASTKRFANSNYLKRDRLVRHIGFIVSESVSRFAQNMVDTLTTIRKLKEKGVGVMLEKESIDALYNNDSFNCKDGGKIV